MKKYWIYGAGKNAEKYVRVLKQMIDIEYIIDKDCKKHGLRICGVKIVSPEVLVNNSDEKKIIVSVNNPRIIDEVYKLLDSFGYKRDYDYINAEKLVNIFPIVSGTIVGYRTPISGYIWGKGIDYKSRLIKRINEEKIYRVIYKGFEDRYEDIIAKCKKYKLFSEGIVKTEVTDEIHELNDYLVLQHEFIKPISYCYEWAPETFKDSVFHVLNFIKRLTNYNLGIDDGHALNLTIHNGKFKLVDFGALCNHITEPGVFIEMLNTQVLPYILMCKNEIEKAYMHLKNADINFSPQDIEGYLTEGESQGLKDLYGKAIDCVSENHIISFIEATKTYLNEISIIEEETRWKGYQNDEWEWSSDKQKWSEKMTSVINLLEEIKPKTIIDLAGNMGWYGSYLREKVEYSIISDLDTSCVGYLWKKIQNEHFDNVIPIYMSLCTPSAAYYKDYPITSNCIQPWRESAEKRFKCDVAIALAIVHHLAFAQQLSFEEIINQISTFTKKYLIIEFIEQTDQYIWDFRKEGFEWYSKENFEKELKRKYSIMEVKKSTPSESRYIYMAMLKETSIEV